MNSRFRRDLEKLIKLLLKLLEVIHISYIWIVQTNQVNSIQSIFVDIFLFFKEQVLWLVIFFDPG